MSFQLLEEEIINKNEIGILGSNFNKMSDSLEKSIAELTKKINTLKSNYKFNNEQLSASDNIIKELNSKEISTAKLLKNRLVSPIDLQDAKVAILEEKIENLKLKTTTVAILKSLQVLTTTY